MRIAILGTRGIPARYGGFETFAEELSVRLVQRGVKVTVYCESGGETPSRFRGIDLVHVPVPPFGPLATIFFDLRCLWNARKDFDIVYMLGYGAAIFCFLPRLWGTEVWLNVDGIEWARSKWGLLAKLWFKLMELASMWTPNRVIADAHAILRHLQSRHSHIPPVSVIPYGAAVLDAVPDAHVLDAWRLKPGRYHLIVCRLEPENSVREIITGYLSSGSRYPLVIIGNIERPGKYVEALLRYKGDRVRFIGTVYDKHSLQALRCHSFAYFHGHTVGGTNPSLLEALGCGNIVIAADNRFNREVAGGAASYFKDEKDVASALGKIESLPWSALHQMKKRAKARIQTRYSWESVTEAYLDLLASHAGEVAVSASTSPFAGSGFPELYRKAGEAAGQEVAGSSGPLLRQKKEGPILSLVARGKGVEHETPEGAASGRSRSNLYKRSCI